MPTQGSSIPVLTVEKFWLDKSARGFHAHDDGSALASVSWTTSTVYGSGAGAGFTIRVLPAASTTAWLKIIWMSGTAGNQTTGFIPIFSGNVIPGKGL